MSAPTLERYSGMDNGENDNNHEKVTAHAAKEVIGKAATNGEIVSHRADLATPTGVEAFLAGFARDAKLEVESTKIFATPSGAEVRAAKITGAEELVQVELPEPDEELGATGLVIDAERIESGNPYLRSKDTLVRVSTTHRGEDGHLVLDRITDPEMKQYATALIADTITKALDASEITEESAGGNWKLHQQSLDLNSAMRSRHSELEL